MSYLEGVLPGGGAALAVVLVSEHDPVDAGLLVLPGHVGHAAVAAGVLTVFISSFSELMAVIRRLLEMFSK